MATEYLVPSVYSTIQLAINAIPADLSGLGIHKLIIDKAVYNETVLVDHNVFSNPSATDYIEINCTSGDELKGIKDSGVTISAVLPLTVRVSYTKIKNIQVTATGQYGIRSRFGLNVKIIDCISLLTGTASNESCYQTYSGATTDFITCIAINKGIGSFRFGFREAISGSGNCYGCTAGGDNTINAYAGIITAYNSVAFDTSGSNFTNSNTGSNNCSEDGTAKGTDPLINQTVASMGFVDKDNNDYHLSSESSVLYNGAGADQASIYTEDMDGEFIPLGEYPIGADFLAPISGGGGVSRNTSMIGLGIGL